MTICQMSTIDGSPKLERQVQKITMQMSNQCPTLKAAGYFNVGRNMILKVCIYTLQKKEVLGQLKNREKCFKICYVYGKRKPM